MLRLTVSLSLVLGLGAVAGEVWVPPAVHAGTEPTDDPVVDWDNRWERAKKDAGNEYIKLAKKYDVKLEMTAAFTRFRVFRYLPDEEETRKFLGYVKEKVEGTENWKWERQDIRRDVIREMADLEDPKSTKYSKDLADADRKVVGWFKGLAHKAKDNGAAKDVTPDAKTKWADKAVRAWEKVLEVDDTSKDAEEAHKELEHPKYQNKYVSKFKLQFMKARDERKTAGQKEAATAIKPVDAIAPDGAFASAGMTGGGAKSTHVVVNATHGKDVAIKCAQDCEKALNDVVAILGYPETIKERLAIQKFNLVKDEPEYRKILEKGFGWKPAKIQKYLDAGFGGTSEGVENINTTSGGADADDAIMSLTALYATEAAQGAARAEIGSSGREDVEDWLKYSICYDVTKRVNGTCILKYGAFGRYGDAIEAPPGEDKWVELARRLVQTDDDVPLGKLVKCKLVNKDIKGPQTIKGWAFIQFVFERDPAKAKQFLQKALADGTPSAVAAFYPDNPDSPDAEKSMEKIDAEYREWILKGW